jgi:hypothetical protein
MTNKTTQKSTDQIGGVSCTADSFVVIGTFVLLINFFGESPALLVVAKLYLPFSGDTLQIRQLY